MGAREMTAAAVLVWLFGAVVGWCAGWAARGEQTRGWYAARVRELEWTRTELDQAHAELDTLHAHLEELHAHLQAEQARPSTSVVAVVVEGDVHLNPPLPPVGPPWWRAVGVVPQRALPPRAPPDVG